MTYTDVMVILERGRQYLSPSRFGRRTALGLAVLGVATLAAQTPAKTASGQDRVRLHWDPTTEPLPSAAGKTPRSSKRERVSLVRDFSHRYVIFSEAVPANLVDKIRSEPRFWHQYLERHGRRSVP